MRERMRRIWYPALVTTALAVLGQAVTFRNVSVHNFVRLGGDFLVVSYQSILLLILCGTYGAWACYRNGGSPRERLFVSQTPLIVHLIVLTYVVATTFIHAAPSLKANASSLGTFTLWAVLIPSMALLVGAVPVIAKEQLEAKAHAA